MTGTGDNRTSVTARLQSAGQARPPMYTVSAAVEMHNRSPDRLWFVLPQWIDHPIPDRSEEVFALELRLDASGVRYVNVFGEPPAAVFHLEPGATVSLPRWDFLAWSEQRTCEVRVAREVTVGELGSMDDILSGPLAEPAVLPGGPAVLRDLQLDSRPAMRLVTVDTHDVDIREEG